MFQNIRKCPFGYWHIYQLTDCTKQGNRTMFKWFTKLVIIACCLFMYSFNNSAYLCSLVTSEKWKHRDCLRAVHMAVILGMGFITSYRMFNFEIIQKVIRNCVTKTKARWWLVAIQATNNYLNQWWPSTIFTHKKINIENLYATFVSLTLSLITKEQSESFPKVGFAGAYLHSSDYKILCWMH